jgi:Predicted membrane protein (DUF2127)
VTELFASRYIIGRRNKTIPKTRPIGVTTLSIFFMAATIITFVASISLLFPIGFLEPLWRINPRGHAGLVSIGVWAVVLLLVVGCACLAAAIGLWRAKRWGYVLAIIVLSINLLGDIANVVSGQEPRAVVGIPIVIAILFYLNRRNVRSYFRRLSSF